MKLSQFTLNFLLTALAVTVVLMFLEAFGVLPPVLF